MERFRMVEVVSLLGLPSPPQGRSAYYLQCPCCDDNPRGKHLNINLKKEVFRCPRCGVSGGIFDLYSLYTGTPKNEVRAALMERLGMGGTVQRRQAPKRPVPEYQEVPESPLADLDTRHAAYSALMCKLTLAEDHRENLLGRGLTENEISQLGYRTAPVAGMAAVTKQLEAEGVRLAGVPGFYRDKYGSWTCVQGQRGILIPTRDRQGRIQGLQLRRDNTEKRKFRWVSSAERQDGCRAEGWLHLAGPVQPKLILTEGPMKADIIHALTGLTVLAVPGVNALTQLKAVLADLRTQGLTEIKTAFDMDFVTNRHVQDGYNNLLQLLSEMGFTFGAYLWDPRYKGLDDYVWECCLGKKRQPAADAGESKCNS